jgi:hypothetical protein
MRFELRIPALMYVSKKHVKTALKSIGQFHQHFKATFVPISLRLEHEKVAQKSW